MPGSHKMPSGLSKDYWYGPEGLVDFPWKFPSRSSKRGAEWKEQVLFHPDRVGKTLLRGGTVEVEVFLKGKWHWVKFATDGEAFLKLSELPERSRSLLLESLVLVPFRANLLKGSGPRRSRGNSKRDAQFWHNIGFWGRAAAVWAESALLQEQKPAVLKQVRILAKSARLSCQNADDLAASVCILAWRAINTTNPSGFPLPRGANLHRAVARRIAADRLRDGNHSFGPDMKKFVRALLRPGKNSEAVNRDIPVVSPSQEFGPTVSMTDFRLF